MSSARSARVAGLGRAAQFSVAAWGDAWFMLALSVAGPAMMFYGEHGPVSRDVGMALMAGGGLWSMLMFAPLSAGLYRSALNRFGSPEGRRHAQGLAGLRLGGGEARMLGLATLMFLLAVLFMAPATAVAAAVAFVFRSQGEVSLLTALRYGAYSGLAVLALYPLVALRVALGGAATIAEDQIRLFQTWPLTDKRTFAVAAPLVAVSLLYPLALGATAWANQFELGEFTLVAGRWPMLDAVAGALASGLFHGALMPALYIGVLTHRYLEWRPQVAPATRRKPVMRVVADVIETGIDEDIVVAEGISLPVRATVQGDLSLIAGTLPEQTRRAASALQIGADRIAWPDHRLVALDTSGQTFAQPTEVAPLAQPPAGVWPELEVRAMAFAPSGAHVRSVIGSVAQPPVYDGEAHEPARSPIDPLVTVLEHPMLLAPHAPDSEIAPEMASDPVAVPSPEPPAGTSEAVYVWRETEDRPDLRDLFWLSGVVPPEPHADAVKLDPVTAPVPETVSETVPDTVLALVTETGAAPGPAPARDGVDAPPAIAVPPTATEAPPPVEAIAYRPPQPAPVVDVAPVRPAAANDEADAAGDVAPMSRIAADRRARSYAMIAATTVRPAPANDLPDAATGHGAQAVTLPTLIGVPAEMANGLSADQGTAEVHDG